MNLRNCPVCGKLFVYVTKNMCPDCIKKEEELFDKVRDYLYENPNSSLEEVNKATGVDVRKILEFLKEGRLILKQGNPYLLSCEICGKAILTGRYCEQCASEMTKKFNKGLKRSQGIADSTLKGQVHLSKLRDRGIK